MSSFEISTSASATASFTVADNFAPAPREGALSAFGCFNPRVEFQAMTRQESFGEFEATSLFCPKCRRATPARSKLLLVLPSGNKYDYVCAECGTAVGVKTDNDASEFYRTTPPRRAPHRGGRS
jgi:hypothetical protein